MLPLTSHFLLFSSALGVAIPTAYGLRINRPGPSRRAPGLPLQWPAPIPADAVGPVDWSSLPPPSYSSYPYHYPPPSQQPRLRPNPNLKQTTTTTSTTSSSELSSELESDPADHDDEIQALYSRVDWRNRTFPLVATTTTTTGNSSSARPPRYQNFITTPQNQGICASCWAFAATALIECMIRIEHGIWSKRSESDIHDGVGASCESTGNIHETLAWIAGVWDDLYGSGSGSSGGGEQEEKEPHGIADWSCDPYQDTPHAYSPCGDRAGRATHIPSYTALGTIDDQKRWLREYGPIVATFVLYEDFQRWGGEEAGNNSDNNHSSTGDGKPREEVERVYRYDGKSGNTTSGNHIALVVGYDDRWGEIEGVQAGGAWIIKNSWGENWGDGGYVYFGYNECNIDGWTKYGIANVSPDPWSRKRHQSGNMMQSSNGGMHRNFELLVATTTNFSSNPNDTTPAAQSSGWQFTHLSRDGTSERWSTVSVTQLDPAPELVHDNQQTPKNETLSRVVGQPVIIGTSYNGGDFHALVPIRRGDNPDSSVMQHWILGDSHYSKSKWRLEGEIKTADGSEDQIAGYPGFVQTDDSSLVMVVRHSDGSLREWRRPPPSPSNASPPWTLTSTIFSPAALTNNISILQSGPSLVQSNIGHSLYDPAGTTLRSSNLYVVALRSDGKMQLFWRTGLGFSSSFSTSMSNTTTTSSISESGSEWRAGEIFGQDLLLPSGQNTPTEKGASSPNATHTDSNRILPVPVMIQSFHDTQNETSTGAFHLVISSPTTGKIQHWRRNNHPDLDLHTTGEGLAVAVSDSDSDSDSAEDSSPRIRWELLEEITLTEQRGGRPGVKNVCALVQGSFDAAMHMVTEQLDGTLSYWEWEWDGHGDGHGEGRRWRVVQEVLPVS